MTDKNKVERIYNKVVEIISRELISTGKASLFGISGKKIPVSINKNGSICNVRKPGYKAAPDLSSLNTIKKHIERYPTKNHFDAIVNTRELREHGMGGNDSLHWAVINKMYSFCDSFEIIEHATNAFSNKDVDNLALTEGQVAEVMVLRRQRNRIARDRCLVESGYKCYICGLEFEKVYGEIGKGFLEVHHKRPISKYDEEHVIPQSELVGLCSNCHSMVHRNGSLIDVDVLKDLYEQNKNNREKY